MLHQQKLCSVTPMSLTTETWRSFFIFKSSLRIEWFHLQHGNSMLSTLDKTSQHVQGSIFLIAHLSDPQASVEKPAAEIFCCLSFSFMLDCVIHVLDWESIFSGFANRSITAAEDGSAYDTCWASATGWMCSGDSGDLNPLCTPFFLFTNPNFSGQFFHFWDVL